MAATTAPAIQTTNPSGNCYQMELFGIKTIVVFNSQITDGDYWWNFIQAIDATYKPDRSYPMNRTLFIKFTDGTYGIFALDVLMNVANLVSIMPTLHSKVSIVETIVKKYLVETIKQLEITPEVANTIGFKMQVYMSAPVQASGTNTHGTTDTMSGMIPATTVTSLGRKGVLDTILKNADTVFNFNTDWSQKMNPKTANYMIGPCFTKPTVSTQTPTPQPQPSVMPSSYIITIANKFGF